MNGLPPNRFTLDSLVGAAGMIFRARSRQAIMAIFLVALPVTGCSGSAQALSRPVFEQGLVCIAKGPYSTRLNVEIARSRLQKRTGLQHRSTLAPDGGMLFIFDNTQAADRAFWMYQTLIPLDIAFLDQQGTILAIQQMEPCVDEHKHNCPLYPAGKPFSYVLETNKGFFARHQVTPGDRVILDPDDSCD